MGLLALVFAFARLVRLDADPSGLLSTAFLTDEGWYSQAARNHAVFGQWSLDEHNVALVLCPLHTFLLRLSYALFGVSFWSTRIVGAFASVLTVGLVAWCLRARPKVATLAAAIVATQPVLFGLSRVAFCENSQLFFVTLTWVAASDQRRRRSSWMLAGAAAALAVVVKGSALYAIALAMVAPFLSTTREGWRRNLREAAWVAVGGVLVAVPFTAFEWQFRHLLILESSREASLLGFPLRSIWVHLLLGIAPEDSHETTHPAFWAGVLPLMIMAGLTGARQLLSRTVNLTSDQPKRVALAWLALSSVQLACTSSLQTRYWMNLLVPLACLIAMGTDGHTGGLREPWRRLAAALVLSTVVLVVAREVLTMFPVEAMDASRKMRHLGLALLFVFLGLTALASWKLRVAEYLPTSARLWTAGTVVIVLAGGLVAGGITASPRYSWRDASRALTADGAPKVLMGDVANSLSLETPYLAFVHRDLARMRLGVGWVNQDWRALGATHYLADTPAANGRSPPHTPIPAAVLLSSRPTWPDNNGTPRRMLYVFALTPALTAAPSAIGHRLPIPNSPFHAKGRLRNP